MAKVKIGDEEFVVSEFSARKALRVMKILREVGQVWPKIAEANEQFRQDYEQRNYSELNRATARFQFGPRPVYKTVTNAEGELEMTDELERDQDGNVVYTADRLAHMTDEDWAKSDQKLRLPKSPTNTEMIVHLLPLGFDIAEEQLLQLCALCVIPNKDLGKAARDGGASGVTDLLHERAEELLDDAMADQLLELLAAAADVIEQQFPAKVKDLGDRVGKLRSLVGLGTTETTETTDSKPPTSTDSQPPTGGGRSERSTEPAGDSSTSFSAV